MRVHSRHIYYLCIALAIIASLFGKVNEKTFLIVELLSVLSILLLDKFMRTIYEIREALYIDINIELFKNIFMIALILINIMVFLKIVKMKKKSA